MQPTDRNPAKVVKAAKAAAAAAVAVAVATATALIRDWKPARTQTAARHSLQSPQGLQGLQGLQCRLRRSLRVLRTQAQQRWRYRRHNLCSPPPLQWR